ncbi:MAG: tyrosine-type recombinase/integrase [Candidatus Dormibacteraceae bacterium]
MLQAFFTDRLRGQRNASPHTVAAYRDAFRLLLAFVTERTGRSPAALDIADLDATMIGSFLDHLERNRGNSVATRNARLAALHSFYRYLALYDPEHAGLIQRVLAIPEKRSDTDVVSFLTEPEVDALLAAPDRSTWTGRRDHALLLLDIQTGLRVSELTGLTCGDTELGTGPHVRCHGKGRKDRITPLTAQTVAVLRVWLAERSVGPCDPLFSTRTGRRLSSDTVEHLLTKHVVDAEPHCPSLHGKRISPHTLRHTAAMRLLESGVDTSVIALWLGHASVKTTQIYLHAHLAIKERALARTAPPNTTAGRYRAPDRLLAFLESL